MKNQKYSEFRKEQWNYANTHDYFFGPIKKAVFETAIFAVYYLKNTFITANTLTFLNLILWIVLPLLLLKGNFELAILSLILMLLTNWLDFADGILARAQKTQSRGGSYFDSFVHAITYPVICMSFGYYSYLQTGIFLDIIAGLIIGLWYPYFFLFESLAVFILVHHKESIKYKMGDLRVIKVEKKKNIKKIIKEIMNRIFNLPELFIILLAVLFLSLLIPRVIQIYLYLAAAISILSISYKFYKNWNYLRGFR